MSDILLGMIIGGVIGVVGSAVVAWIQGHYSLSGKREENSARQQQQSTQIQHEKDSQLISRLIARRLSYLEPLSSHLSALYTALDNYQKKLIEILNPYFRDPKSDKIQVPEVNKQEFGRQLRSTKTSFGAIITPRAKIWEASSHVADLKLLKEINALSKTIRAFYAACQEMYGSFNDSTTGHDFVYDFESLVESITSIELDISNAHRRIDSLLAGVDEDDE